MGISYKVQRILDKSPEQIQELVRKIGFDTFLNIFGRFDFSDYLLYPHFTKAEIVEYASRKSDLEKLVNEGLSTEIENTEKAFSEIEEPTFYTFYRSINFDSTDNINTIESYFSSKAFNAHPTMKITQVMTLLAAAAHYEGLTAMLDLQYPQSLPEIKKGIEALTKGSSLVDLGKIISLELMNRPAEYRQIIKTGFLLIGQAKDEHDVYKVLYTIYRDSVLDISYLDYTEFFKNA